MAENLSQYSQDPPWELNARSWQGSFNGRESSLHQLSPYVGKLKSGMAKVLIELYSQPGEIILDPFAGSGVVPLESVLSGRIAWANDLSPYAYILTRGKLETPREEQVALATANSLLDQIESEIFDLRQVPQWVRDFFHPQTLPEIISTFRLLAIASLVVAIAARFFWLKNNTRKAESFLGILADVEKYNDLIEVIHLNDQLEDVGNTEVEIINRKQVITALRHTRENLIRALKTERIFRVNQQVINRNPDLFAHNLTSVEAMQMSDRATERGRLLNEALQIALNAQAEMRKLKQDRLIIDN
jgi:hypothetical protein